MGVARGSPLPFRVREPLAHRSSLEPRARLDAPLGLHATFLAFSILP